MNKSLTIKQLGSITVIGKASTITSQLEAIAAHATLGTCPMQDIDSNAAHYSKLVSFEVMK